jgi:hypothetical protein
MKKLIAVLSTATALIAAAAASAPCGDVVGEISDALGQPVPGTQSRWLARQAPLSVVPLPAVMGYMRSAAFIREHTRSTQMASQW